MFSLWFCPFSRGFLDRSCWRRSCSPSASSDKVKGQRQELWALIVTGKQLEPSTCQAGFSSDLQSRGSIQNQESENESPWRRAASALRREKKSSSVSATERKPVAENKTQSVAGEEVESQTGQLLIPDPDGVRTPPPPPSAP